VAAKIDTGSFLDDVSAPFWEVSEYNATLIEFPQLGPPQIPAPEDAQRRPLAGLTPIMR
jgi:hypothetical protein